MFLHRRTGMFSVMALMLAGVVLWANMSSAQAKSVNTEPKVIVLTASWCATCREITPAVQRVIQSNPELGLQMVTLDVDSNSAPGQANAYGISVAGGDVPQVFLYSNGKTVLLFNGKGYKFGHAAQVEAQIREALKTSF